MNNIWALAQAAANQEPTEITSAPVNSKETSTKTESDPNVIAPAKNQKIFGPQQLIVFGLIFVMMYLLLFRGPRKKQQEHKQMVQSLKKNDKVRTIGGIIGTVIDVKDDEITLKVDESNNTKIKVIPSAIGKNISENK